MRRNFMWGLCHAAGGAMPAGRPARGEAEDVDGPGTGPEVAQAVAHGCPGDLPRGTGGFQRRVAEREVRGERGGGCAARAVGRAVRVALAGDELDRLAVEEHVGGDVAVAAGDDDVLRAELVQAAHEALCVLSV